MQAGDSTFNAAVPVLLGLIGGAGGGWKIKDPRSGDPYRRNMYAPDGTCLGQHHIEDAKHFLRLIRKGEGRWVPEAFVESVLDALVVKLDDISDGLALGRWVRTNDDSGRVTLATPGGQATAKALPVGDVEAYFGNVRCAIRRTAP